MRYFIVWLNHNDDPCNDEPIKIKANNKKEAGTIATAYLNNRFTVGQVFTMSGFRTTDPWWHKQIADVPARNEKDNIK